MYREIRLRFIFNPQFRPKFRQDAYDALRAFNLELVRLPELVSNPTIGQMRMQFWRDAVKNTFAGKPPKEPIMILLHKVLRELSEQFPEGAAAPAPSTLHGQPPLRQPGRAQEYAEHTYSTLMYAALAALPIQSMHVDHLASHIGKACGIAAVLRGIPTSRRRTRRP
ncbi:hypothetical protein PG994_003943 [Apiospora phragmitis]|uniref:Uncharacterized protein n=1 Tax=Apiospora phragmitis TaxID=2905665 RepID=A0ABR1W253_9PEZI